MILRPDQDRGTKLEDRGNSKKKNISFCLFALLLALSYPVEAQQTGKVPRIGYVTDDPLSPNIEAFRQGLRDLGYIEGKNIVVEYRYSEGKNDRMPSLVAELVRLGVDILVSGIGPAIRAAKQASKTIPIVVVAAQDPVATGLLDSLARPGGNITGLTRMTRDLAGKRLELLKEAVLGISRIGVLWSTTEGLRTNFQNYEAAARALKIPLQSLVVRGPSPDLEGAFQAATTGHVSALIAISTSLLSRNAKHIAGLAIKNRLPLMCERRASAEVGGLMSYSANEADVYRRAATYVDKIIKGAKPAELPVEQPTKFELVINLKTAKQIGVTIPQWVLVKADKVIR